MVTRKTSHRRRGFWNPHQASFFCLIGNLEAFQSKFLWDFDRNSCLTLESGKDTDRSSGSACINSCGNFVCVDTLIGKLWMVLQNLRSLPRIKLLTSLTTVKNSRKIGSSLQGNLHSHLWGIWNRSLQVFAHSTAVAKLAYLGLGFWMWLECHKLVLESRTMGVSASSNVIGGAWACSSSKSSSMLGHKEGVLSSSLSIPSSTGVECRSSMCVQWWC